MPEDTTQKSATGASRSFSVSRRQLLGTAAAGAAVTTLPSLPAFAQDAGHTVDVLLVGGGIMSATLGVLLSELEPGWTYHMVERLDAVAEESSNGWNNAGTGHSALCELNYSPMDANGDIHIEKAIDINEQWQLTRQFLAYQVERGVLSNPRSFLNSTPHMSFVWGDENVDFLTKRFAALQTSPLFAGMQFSTDHAKIAEWVPLMMEGRDPNQKLAATWSPLGTDANWGEVTRQYIAHLNTLPNFKLQTGTEVTDIARNDDNTWRVTVEPTDGGEAQVINAKYLFLGAGGGALPLLQMSGIPEGDAYAGFPVGGSFLVCENPEVAEQHLAKAYGQASTGAPPMSVPHLDTRVLDGKRMVLFGPFATFSTKFLKNGSYFDLPASVTLDNIWPMMKVGFTEFNLVEYLAGQLMLSQDDRVAALKEYYPEARAEDWTFWQAGQRVQIIKADPEKGGVLKLGTELVASEDGTLTALLGASPGASTAAPIMLNWLKRVMPQKLETAEWQARMTEIIPSYGQPLNDNPEMLQAQWNRTAEVLELALAMPVINEDQLQQRQDDYQSPSGTVTPRSDMAL